MSHHDTLLGMRVPEVITLRHLIDNRQMNATAVLLLEQLMLATSWDFILLQLTPK